MATLARLSQIPVTELSGVGPASARALANAGIQTVADLLHFIPHRYMEAEGTTIATASKGAEVTIQGQVRTVRDRRPRRNLLIIEAVLADETGTITAVWFNQRHMAAQLQPGSWWAVTGVVDTFAGKKQIRVRLARRLAEGEHLLRDTEITPVHSQVGQLKPWKVAQLIRQALKRSRPVADPVPVEFLATHGLVTRDDAFQNIHFPQSMDQVGHARRRLVYDEFFRLELALALQKRRRLEESRGVAHEPTGELTERFLSGLPYRLTGAQRRVIDEITADLRGPYPMHRLLQGEVGSGKTVVAVMALLAGVEGGWQGAIMAPTEVLAEQHYLGVTHLLAEAGMSPEPFGQGARLGMASLFETDEPAVRVGLLTGNTAASNYDPEITRATLLEDVAAGRVDMLVGTHALIQEGVEFARLGVAIVDEQHRFGVHQRIKLKEKAAGIDPDLLIMTATPIPRTLSMTLYGDLDVSVIDEMPPGRAPVITRHVHKAQEGLAWDLVRQEVAKGRQAFVVCPLVEDSDKVEAASATAEHARLSAIFSDLRVGLIHGQMRPADKEQVMAAFRAGDIDVLVSTTVIEVGIDVPNATVMVIEDADRFGLSQLHQLRGRVGRGSHRGHCVVISDPPGEEAEMRLSAFVSTTDGFELANVDLAIRGQGTVFGARQSGMGDLRVADLLEDFEMLIAARRDAFGLVASDPDLVTQPALVEEIRAVLGDRVEWLFVS
ncbi:MAG: ATP-dependent DNA helicase RecG [Actinomycetes bacterium]|jgi:ATP-dependent DNA helicase RecG|nr:MAG: DNA helicase RecG [Actinomycetota bacterium]